ncbi:MAG: hypothetical protein WCC27_09785, partial [Acidobacteriaceae bacterium]
TNQFAPTSAEVWLIGKAVLVGGGLENRRLDMTEEVGLHKKPELQRSKEPSPVSTFSVGGQNSRVRGHCEQPFG